MLKKIIKYFLRRIYNCAAYETNSLLRSIYWGQIYNNTITNSEWLVNKGISPGRWAVGYEYLYVLYRALNELRPSSILELGLGQSTKVISQYAKYAKVNHIVVEHDSSWRDFFLQGWNELSEYTDIHMLPLKQVGTGSNKYFEYKDFDKLVDKKNFDIISIDAPFGGEGILSRRDILYVLPAILSENFVILFDDCGRPGEKKTVEDAESILAKNGISYYKGIYAGEGDKITIILTSESWKFLCTL